MDPLFTMILTLSHTKYTLYQTERYQTLLLKMKLIYGVVLLLRLLPIVFSVKYKMIYQGHEFCADPDPPYEEPKKLDVSLDLVNNNDKLYYNANITVKEKLSGYLWRFKIGFEKSGKVIYENDFKGLNCKSFIFKVISGISNIKYDPDTCDIFKGSYSINKLEVSTLDKAVNLLPTRRIGINVYFLSYFKPKGTCVCLQSRILFTKP